MAVRAAAAAALALALLRATAEAACGVAGLTAADAATWTTTGAGADERCYKVFGVRHGRPSSWADCVATCQSNDAAGYAAGRLPSGRTATVASIPDPATLFLVEAQVLPQLTATDKSEAIWIGYNSLEGHGDEWRWVADGDRDPRVDGAEAVSDGGMIEVPWGSDQETTWVGELGSCEATQMCMGLYVVRDNDRSGELVAEPMECDGPDSVQRCLCEFSAASAVAPAFNTTDGTDGCLTSDDAMCTSHHLANARRTGSGCAASVHDERHPTCRNGYTVLETGSTVYDGGDPDLQGETMAEYCELQHKCRMLWKFSIENAEIMEKYP